MLFNKRFAIFISVCTALLLALVKLIGGLITGSVSVLASALDSLLDIVTSSINYFALKKSEQPPDKDHRYGHGKFESLASLFQAAVITFSGLYIIYESYNRFVDKKEISDIEGGIWVMLFSLVATVLLVIYLRTAAKKSGSSILKTESLHYEIDLLTGFGVLIGLGLVKITGLSAIDPLISVLIAVKTIYSAMVLGKEVSDELLDKTLSEEDMKAIDTVMHRYKNVIGDWHHLRTRKAGGERFVDMHIHVNKDLTVSEAHDIADCIENDIKQTINGADVQIHIEPCEKNCTDSACFICDSDLRKELENLKNK